MRKDTVKSTWLNVGKTPAPIIENVVVKTEGKHPDFSSLTRGFESLKDLGSIIEHSSRKNASDISDSIMDLTRAVDEIGNHLSELDDKMKGVNHQIYFDIQPILQEMQGIQVSVNTFGTIAKGIISALQKLQLDVTIPAEKIKLEIPRAIMIYATLMPIFLILMDFLIKRYG